MTKTTAVDVVEAWREQQKAYQATASKLDRTLEHEFDLGLSEFEILDLVSEANDDKCQMRDLVGLTPMTQSALSRVVDRLTRAGLLGRDECSFDRRSLFVSLTPEGAAVHARARKVYRQLLSDELG
jgi:DNA-binding MarR family transcriptional regulator